MESFFTGSYRISLSKQEIQRGQDLEERVSTENHLRMRNMGD